MTEPTGDEAALDALARLPVDVFAGRRRRRGPRLRPRVLTAVAGGAFAGGLARYAVTLAWPTPVGAVPWATFGVNTIGAFTLALLLMLVTEVWRPTTYVRPLLGTGFLGAFTTFSAVVTTTDQLAGRGAPGTAARYLVISMFAGLAAASFGLVTGRAVATARHRDPAAATGRT